MKYPFIPKSNLKLERGEYFNIPLNNGHHAYVMILDLPDEKDRRGFYIGLLNITSVKPEIKNGDYKIIKQWNAHIKTIEKCGGMIQGKLIPITPNIEKDCASGQNCNVVQGYRILRKATDLDRIYLDVQRTSGYMVPKIIAEKHFRDLADVVDIE
jgi:hypothetical protein